MPVAVTYWNEEKIYGRGILQVNIVIDYNYQRALVLIRYHCVQEFIK
jgi:hypothetical protein